MTGLTDTILCASCQKHLRSVVMMLLNMRRPVVHSTPVDVPGYQMGGFCAKPIDVSSSADYTIYCKRWEGSIWHGSAMPQPQPCLSHDMSDYQQCWLPLKEQDRRGGVYILHHQCPIAFCSGLHYQSDLLMLTYSVEAESLMIIRNWTKIEYVWEELMSMSMFICIKLNKISLLSMSMHFIQIQS